MDIKEKYKQRYTELKEYQTDAHNILNKLHTEKAKFLAEAVAKAKKEAEAEFDTAHHKEDNDASYLLARANDELMLLRCPNEKCHYDHNRNYYRCDVCSFIYDDTSPAHP